VLFGRGGRSGSHPGNQTYLKKKDEMQSDYLAAPKSKKKTISQALVDFVHQRKGRFLKQENGRPDQWYIVLESTALDKASQALREINTPEERQKKRAKYSKKTCQ
jgi:hypothetical protein